MGRVTASSQQIGSGTTPYGFSYTYDLSGALQCITYPTRRTVSYTRREQLPVDQAVGVRFENEPPCVATLGDVVRRVGRDHPG